MFNPLKNHHHMTLNDYQVQAMTTCMASCHNFSYMMLNLVGEVGELASKVAKTIRRRSAIIDDNDLTFPLGIAPGEATDLHRDLMLEAGDILWQLAGMCHAMGWTLEDVAAANLAKLASRKERGVIDGNGDHR